jgi:hypothetical protein
VRRERGGTKHSDAQKRAPQKIPESKYITANWQEEEENRRRKEYEKGRRKRGDKASRRQSPKPKPHGLYKTRK